MKAHEDFCSRLVDLEADFWVGLEEGVGNSFVTLGS